MPEETQPTPQPTPQEELTRRGTPDEDHALDPKNERDLWQGRQSWKTAYPALALWIVVIAAAAVLIGLVVKTALSVWITLGVGAVVLLLILLRTAYQVMSRSYRITTQRLFLRMGILSQTVDQAELLRVEDVKMRQTLLERMLGIGTVEVFSSDRSDARVEMRGVDQPAQVAEHIRQHTRILQKRTLFMEQL